MLLSIVKYMIPMPDTAVYLREVSASRRLTHAALLLVGLLFSSAVLPSTLWQPDDYTLLQAKAAESGNEIDHAIDLYRRYLNENPNSTIKTLVMNRLSVLQEAKRFGVDGALELYLQAMDAREARRFDDAISMLKQIPASFPDSYLNDDALYLRAYIAMMDDYQFAEARELFGQLRSRYPDTTYIDTALYSEAISVEQMGDTEAALKLFEDLRQRHTEFSLSIIGVRWPKSDYLSRYWYDRANNRIGLINQRQNNAARLISTAVDKNAESANYDLRVEIAIEGRRFPLLLRTSNLVKNTHFDTESELTLALSKARYFSGQVEGDPDSWARVMIRGQEIEGIVETRGQRIDLTPASMVGTLQYYKPDKGRPGTFDQHRLQDYVLHPPPDPEAFLREKLQVGELQGQPSQDEPALGAAIADTVNRLVRLSVYVDSQYNDFYGGDGLLRAMSALNVADGIYRRNFGLAIEVGSATVFTDRATDPMNLGAVTLEKTLRTFRDFHMRVRDRNDDIALTYLFSGNDNTDEAIGLAWIGAVCRSDGFDVGVTTPSTYADLLVTHELGHSLGAQHDSDTSCSATRNLLMWPRISGSTTQSFSNCSQNSVRQGVSKSCLLDTIDVSVDVHSSGPSGVVASVTNNDIDGIAEGASLHIQAAALDLDVLPTECSETAPAEVACALQSLAPGETATIELQFSEHAEHNASLVASVAAGGYYDVLAINDSVNVTLDTLSDDNSLPTIADGGNRDIDESDQASGLNASLDSDASGSVGGGGSSDWILMMGGVLAGFWMRSLPAALNL